MSPRDRRKNSKVVSKHLLGTLYPLTNNTVGTELMLNTVVHYYRREALQRLVSSLAP
jgi:hypothetical protein